MHERSEDPPRRQGRSLLSKIGMAAAYLCFPYSLPAIVLGTAVYFLKIRDDDTSGDDFLPWTVGAPVTLPLMAYEALRERFVDGPARATKQARNWLIVQELATALRSRGIAIKRTSDTGLTLLVEADLADGQEEAFGEAVAVVAKRHPEIPLDEFCASIRPPGPLDEAWARRHGLDDWAVDVGIYCHACGRKICPFFLFGGTRVSDWARREAEAPDASMAMAFVDGKHFTFPSDTCNDCRNALIGGTAGDAI